MDAFAPTPPILLTAEEAAKALGVSRSTFFKLDRNGRLGPRGVKLGACRRWSREELAAWVRAGCPPRPEWIGQRTA